MFKTYKLFLQTSEKDISILESQSKIANDLYNTLLEKVLEQQALFQEKKPTSFNIFSAYDLRNQVPPLKAEHPVYKTLYSSCAKNVAFRLAYSISKWKEAFLAKSKKRFVGFPQYRSLKEKGFFSLKYEDPFVGYKIEDNVLHLSLGEILVDGRKERLRLSLPFRKRLNIDFTRIKTLTINKDLYSKEYFAEIVIEIKDLPKQPFHNLIILDPNHSNLAVGMDNDGWGTTFHNLYSIPFIDKRLLSLKKKRRKTIKGSRRYNYLNNKILDLYRVRREQIKVFLRAIANYLCANYDLIAIGDYVPFKVNNSFANKQRMGNSFLGEFRRTLEHIAARSGKTYIRYNEKNTSRTCSSCSFVHSPIDPLIKEWICSKCNSSHNRDENAAMNGYIKIRDEINNLIQMLPGSGYLPDKLILSERYTCRWNGRKLVRMKLPLEAEKLQEIKSINENDGSILG